MMRLKAAFGGRLLVKEIFGKLISLLFLGLNDTVELPSLFLSGDCSIGLKRI